MKALPSTPIQPIPQSPKQLDTEKAKTLKYFTELKAVKGSPPFTRETHCIHFGFPPETFVIRDAIQITEIFENGFKYKYL